MNIKQAAENHVGLFFLGTLAVGFAAGWGAFSAVQLATGNTTISVDRLKQLEGPDAQEKKSLLAKIEELEFQQSNLRQQILTNRPTTGNYVRNVVLSPPSPAVLRVGTRVSVKFDYVLTKGESAIMSARAVGCFVVQGNSAVSSSGTFEGGFVKPSAGKVEEVVIDMRAEDGESLYNMTVPVEYTFK